MKLYDMKGKTINCFEGGTTELSCNDVTKSFTKAKKMVLAALNKDLQRIQNNIERVQQITEEDCLEVGNPFD